MFQVKKVVYEGREFDDSEIITITEASKLLGITPPGVISMVNRGGLTEVYGDVGRSRNIFRKKRVIIRAEVDALLAEK